MVITRKSSAYTDKSTSLPFGYSSLKLTSNQHDIDVLIETQNLDILSLREDITRMNQHFASAGMHFYFVQVRD